MDPALLLIARNKSLAYKLFYASLIKEGKFEQVFSPELYSESDCKSLFRFTYDQLKKLRKLLHIPWKIKCKNGTSCSGLEGLCMLLRRLSYPNRLVDLKFVFHRNEIEISMIINHVLNHVLEKFEHLITDLDQWWLTKEWLSVYSAAVSAKGAPLGRCWGFIDGTVRPMCRPTRFQKESYNGHKRVHALKYQSIVLPNGLIANLFGPIEGRRHDAFLLSQSGILPKLEFKNTGEVQPFCLYGDPAYPLRPELLAPFKGSRLTPNQNQFNKKMSMSRISVEWMFGKILSLFAFVDYKKNQRLYLQPLSKYFKVATILTNVHTCINGSQVSDFFGLEPPSIEQYLKLQGQL